MVPHLLLAVPVVPSQPLKLLNRQTDRYKRERENNAGVRYGAGVVIFKSRVTLLDPTTNTHALHVEFMGESPRTTSNARFQYLSVDCPCALVFLVRITSLVSTKPLL